ncbi:unnamed protein product [Gongylonema pulchrum]|uniref:Uncharacterized protein n=1 Tax=Gongylonema pulchrum TaxID=637853 RepID=A0A183D667_9BILA|nr:unnamed protein product [Gongylonema pulchrum]
MPGASKQVEGGAGTGDSETEEEQLDLEECDLEEKLALRDAYAEAVFDVIYEELKEVLIKDVERKIETIAFEKLEQRWDEMEHSSAQMVQQRSIFCRENDESQKSSEVREGAVTPSDTVAKAVPSQTNPVIR